MVGFGVRMEDGPGTGHESEPGAELAAEFDAGAEGGSQARTEVGGDEALGILGLQKHLRLY